MNDRATLAADLAQTLRELGDMRAASIRNYASAFADLSYLNITERSKTAQQHVASIAAEIVVLEAEVEALRVELAQHDWSSDHG